MSDDPSYAQGGDILRSVVKCPPGESFPSHRTRIEPERGVAKRPACTLGKRFFASLRMTSSTKRADLLSIRNDAPNEQTSCVVSPIAGDRLRLPRSQCPWGESLPSHRTHVEPERGVAKRPAYMPGERVFASLRMTGYTPKNRSIRGSDRPEQRHSSRKDELEQRIRGHENAFTFRRVPCATAAHTSLPCLYFCLYFCLLSV